jgi:hypothetical protein
MSTDQLEKRLAAIERALADVQQKLDALIGGPNPKSRWWEKLGPPMTDEERQEYEAAAPYRAYIRQTGDLPPPDWRPGDPIPEPDHWK